MQHFPSKSGSGVSKVHEQSICTGTCISIILMLLNTQQGKQKFTLGVVQMSKIHEYMKRSIVDKHLLKLLCIWNTFITFVIIMSGKSGKSHSSPETTSNSPTQKRFQRRDNMEGGFHSGNPTTFFSPISYSRTGTGYY